MMARGRGENRVVPVTVELVSLEADASHLLVGDGHAVRITSPIEFRSDAEPRPTVCRGDQADNDGETDERRAAPVHGDVRKKAMLDSVPLARPRWEVTHRDGQAGPIGELLQFPLPEANAGAVAAAGVRGDHQGSRVGIRVAAHLSPPPADSIDRKARGVVIDPDTDPAF